MVLVIVGIYDFFITLSFSHYLLPLVIVLQILFLSFLSVDLG